MSIRVALHHRTRYNYDRPIVVGPQTIRLRPAPHSRTPILAYSLKVQPESHFVHWGQDPHGNYFSRVDFREKTDFLEITVDLIAEMSVINPFDFFVEDYAEEFPFEYDSSLQFDLIPYRKLEESGPLLKEYLGQIDQSPRRTNDFLVMVNANLQKDINYAIRMEPGVQTCEETLERRNGSCRDSAWLLMQILRHFGFATRFVSGYLIQLAPDQKSLDGPSGTEVDFTDLHAWCEVFLPGAGWIGLDATSGLLATEGHIPLACSPHPTSAAPITGSLEKCEVEFEFEMKVERVYESPRVTKPYTDAQWDAVLKTGALVDERLKHGDVRLTMGGEPTFVSIDDMEGDEWTTAAVGKHKRDLSIQLLNRLKNRFAPQGMLHFGQGKWYPGEPLPRWAMTCLWRKDGDSIWEQDELIAEKPEPEKIHAEQAAEFTTALCENLGIDTQWVRPAYEDIWNVIKEEQKLPVNVDLTKYDADKAEERTRLARALEEGVTDPVGFILPLKRAWWQAQAVGKKPIKPSEHWISGPWPFRGPKMFLIPGDSPVGLRLPLESLPHRNVPAGQVPVDVYEVDPFEPRESLPHYVELRNASQQTSLEVETAQTQIQRRPGQGKADSKLAKLVEQDLKRQAEIDKLDANGEIVRTALTVEPRDGTMYVFMPPLERLEDYLDLTAIIETTAETLKTPVKIEGYLPPHDQRVDMIKVTPDPGVIEVNVHPSENWDQLVETTTAIYEEARLCRLGTEKFQLDGRHTGTGGGNHIVMGGATPSDSPFLRRPDLLGSMLAYWNNHPSLSYLFSGLFIGPTSQAPRVDEGRRDAIYELQIALDTLKGLSNPAPWIVDRLFRHLLVDLTGNTHRAEFCIDKMYSPDSSTGRLGLLELRAFEMPPHAQMSLTQQLLIRSLIAWFWDTPYEGKLIDWGTKLHDQFMLPYYLMSDFRAVISDLNSAGIPMEHDWFAPHIEFRCPLIGEVAYAGVHMEIRQALETWYVLGEESAGGGTARFVDSSVERVQVKISGAFTDRYCVTCNGRKIPLQPTGIQGEYVGVVRYRAWQPPSCLHPTIPIQAPLVFDIVDKNSQRSIGGCRYHVDHAGGLNPTAFPVNALEAESRRACRFFKFGHTPGKVNLIDERPNLHYPHTLDLRRSIQQ